MTNTKFNSVLIVGVGLIGSSLARAIKENDLAINIYGIDNNLNNLKKCEELKLLSRGESSLDNFSEQFDMIIICSPLSTYKKIFFNLNNYISRDTLITDVGSTKMSVINNFKETATNKHLFFIPSHPIAGLEKSGPEFGFAKLFVNRFCIITPFEDDANSLKKVSIFWNSIGMKLRFM